MRHKRRWPWIAQQTWDNVLFVHFPVPFTILNKYIPEPFTLETYNGQAWIGIILFEAKNSRLRGMPKLPSYRYFLQLNIRTYVKFGSESGVYFFSIDASRKLPVIGATLVSLPYYFAQMDINKYGNKFHFQSKRLAQKNQAAEFNVDYKPISEPLMSENDSLIYWFTERYCIWTIKGNKIYKGPISHNPWTLHTASIDLSFDHDHELFTFFDQASILAHYSSEMISYVHPFEQKGIYLK